MKKLMLWNFFVLQHNQKNLGGTDYDESNLWTYY